MSTAESPSNTTVNPTSPMDSGGVPPPALSVSEIVQRALLRNPLAALASTTSASRPTARSRGRPRASTRAPAASTEPPPSRPQKRQKLQLEKLKHQKIFENQVEVLTSNSGFSKKKYRCRRCACIKPTRITAIQHAVSCGKKFTGKRRKKNGKTKFTCNQCPFRAGTLAQLALHRRRSHLARLNRSAHRFVAVF